MRVQSGLGHSATTEKAFVGIFVVRIADTNKDTYTTLLSNSVWLKRA